MVLILLNAMILYGLDHNMLIVHIYTWHGTTQCVYMCTFINMSCSGNEPTIHPPACVQFLYVCWPIRLLYCVVDLKDVPPGLMAY